MLRVGYESMNCIITFGSPPSNPVTDYSSLSVEYFKHLLSTKSQSGQVVLPGRIASWQEEGVEHFVKIKQDLVLDVDQYKSQKKLQEKEFGKFVYKCLVKKIQADEEPAKFKSMLKRYA